MGNFAKSAGLVWLPAILGLCVFAVVRFDLHQFEAGDASIRAMLNREMPLVAAGLVSAVITLFYLFRSLFIRRWARAAASGASILVFLACVAFAGARGAAFMYAT